MGKRYLDGFDFRLGQRLMEKGLDQAGSSALRQELLGSARYAARKIAEVKGCVTADDVRREMGEHYDGLGPAAGSIFRGCEWKFTGEWVPSTWAPNHTRMLRVWRLAGG